MTKILGFGHYKQSGKSSICQSITNYISQIPYEIRVTQVCHGHGDVQDWAEQWRPTVNTYSFADKLKQFCQEVLGLTYAQCYGSDEDKQSLTDLRWEDMPGVCTKAVYSETEIRYHQELGLIMPFRSGYMTAREVLQHFGTDICRRMAPNCWVDATMRQIEKDAPDYALIPDMRFPNEADAIKLNGGATIKFLRRPFPDDDHPSEISLDDYKFDFVFDNRDWTMERKDREVIETLKLTGWLP